MRYLKIFEVGLGLPRHLRTLTAYSVRGMPPSYAIGSPTRVQNLPMLSLLLALTIA